jgi:hypothetical protein
MGDAQFMPGTHSQFVKKFVDVAGEVQGKLSHDPGASKRQKVLSKATQETIQKGKSMTAPLARFALGGDDNMYLQMGLSVLHTASPGQALAPAALYNLDAVHAIRDGIQRNVLTELKRRKKEAPEKLEFVRQRLLRIFGDMDFDKLLPYNLRFRTDLQAKYSADKNEDFKDMLYDMLKAVDSVLAKDILAEFMLQSDIDAARDMDAALDDGLDTESTAPSLHASQIVKYTVSRGICGHRGPMEPSIGAPTDSLLSYDAPKNIASEVQLAKGMRLPEGATVELPEPSRVGVDEAMAALGGNYAVDDVSHPSDRSKAVKDARQVRWEPVGEYAEALARAAALEHAAARCGQVLADPNMNLSQEAITALENARLCIKLTQMDSLHELSCAAEDGTSLHIPPDTPLVTRPVATIRGKIHFAHDAGHHVAPTAATVLADTRWTEKHIREDAEFRRLNPTGGIYKAPAPHELGYLPVATGAPAQRSDFPVDPTDASYPHGAILKAVRSMIEYGLYYADIPNPDSIAATLNGSSASQSKDAIGTATTRRSGIWNEMLRDIAISTDRLWTFVRTLSGLIGEDADSLLITADEASAAAARDLQAQRRATADRVAAFQGKIVESLIGSMMKESGLRLDTSPEKAEDSLVVINGDTAKQINDLASGESGRPFFEANVALRSLTERGAGGKHKLGDVVAQLNGVVRQLHNDLDTELLSPQTAGASLAELSLPRNSYFVRLREDTTAAIRSSYDKFSVECAVKGIGRICLWELIEGADHTLCTRFAEFVGHVLIQNRTSTGVSALYVSRQQLTVNASQAHCSLQRLINHAAHYRSNYPYPAFETTGTNTLNDLRDDYFQSHRSQSETWVGTSARVAIAYAQDRHFKFVERNLRPADPMQPHLRKWVYGYN